MKRFHVHVAVSNLEKSTQFYSAMFGMQPTVKKDDYAKWMMEDPRVNFAISERSGKPGVNHLGFQAESDDELEEIHTRLKSADTAIVAEEGADCCYAKSDKYWVEDPSGIAWESFRSLGSIPFYGDNIQIENSADKDAQVSSQDSSQGSTEGIVKSSSGCSTACCPKPVAMAACAVKGAVNTAIEKSNIKACCNG